MGHIYVSNISHGMICDVCENYAKMLRTFNIRLVMYNQGHKTKASETLPIYTRLPNLKGLVCNIFFMPQCLKGNLSDR